MLIYGDASQGKRNYQEDSFLDIKVNGQGLSGASLVLLADGMGGHAGGDVASESVVTVFAEAFSNDDESPVSTRLMDALDAANDNLAFLKKQRPELADMGCTLIGAVIQPHKLHWVSVGDSHIYLVRNGSIRKLNADHSMMGEFQALVEQGKMSEAEARSHPKRNALRSAMVGGEISLIDIDKSDLRSDDVLIFSTDGLDTLSAEAFGKTVKAFHTQPPSKLVEALLDAVDAVDAPRQDNTTVIVAKPAASSGLPVPFVVPKLSGQNLVIAVLSVIIAILLALIVYLLIPPEPEPELQEVDTQQGPESISNDADEIGIEEQRPPIPPQSGVQDLSPEQGSVASSSDPSNGGGGSSGGAGQDEEQGEVGTGGSSSSGTSASGPDASGAGDDSTTVDDGTETSNDQADGTVIDGEADQDIKE